MTWFVYVVSEHGGEFCKIGRSSDVLKRVAYLATGNPRRLTVAKTWSFNCRDDAINIERVALDIAWQIRVGRGEWLFCNPADAIGVVEEAIDRSTAVPA